MKSILFVCLGNICRSPMAEYLFRHTAAERGLAVSCASAGTSGWHNGEFMHQGTDHILSKMGIAHSRFISSSLKNSDFSAYDYLIGMDDDNLRDLTQRYGRHPDKIFKITDLVGSRPFDHIPDPWYTGDFGQTRDLLLPCCEALADKLTEGSL